MKTRISALAVAVMAMLACAAGASATSFTTTTGGPTATPTLHLVNEGGHVTLANPIANISCSSTIEAKIQGHGLGIPASGAVTTLLFTGCTNSWHVTSLANGVLAFTYTSGHNGSVTSSGARIDTTRFGVTCVYKTENTTIGTYTGGNPGTIKLEGSIPIDPAESSWLCGTPSASKWEGSYVTTSAAYLEP